MSEGFALSFPFAFYVGVSRSRKDLIVVVDESGETRTAICYFGETVGFDHVSKIKLVKSGDVTTDYSFGYWN